MNKSRLEAFTDAIVAIAATIMVLELHTPAHPTLAGFLEEIPTFLTYIVSFVLIYLVWYNHHNLFNKATVISTRTYFLNGLWIFWLTLIPFTTRWVGAAPDKTAPELFYTLDLFLWSFSFQLMDHSILRDNPDAAADETDSPVFRTVMYAIYGVSVVMAFIVPVVPLFLFAALDVFWVFFVRWSARKTAKQSD